MKILKSLWIVQKSTLVAKFHNNFPILPQKDPENPLKMEISIENYHLVSKFPVLTGNSWVGGSSFSEIPVSRHMFTYLYKCPPWKWHNPEGFQKGTQKTLYIEWLIYHIPPT